MKKEPPKNPRPLKGRKKERKKEPPTPKGEEEKEINAAHIYEYKKAGK